MRFKQFLQEGKQVGILYHFTSCRNGRGILKKGYLESGTEGDYFSFTRNFDLRFVSNEPWGGARLVFDGNKLSNKYKVEPFCDLKGGVNRQANECEERIMMQPWKAITKEHKRLPKTIPIKAYLLHVDILDDITYAASIMSFQEILEDKGIDYNIVREYKPYR